LPGSEKEGALHGGILEGDHGTKVTGRGCGLRSRKEKVAYGIRGKRGSIEDRDRCRKYQMKPGKWLKVPIVSQPVSQIIPCIPSVLMPEASISVFSNSVFSAYSVGRPFFGRW
jgi:hypothetical protein